MNKVILLLSLLLIACNTGKDQQKHKSHKSIIVAGGSITEIIYLLEEDSRILAVDVTSVYPEEAKDKPNIGYVRNLSAEGIVALSPDLVIGEDDMGPISVIEQLKELNLDVKTIEEKQHANGILEKIRDVAEILNVKEKGKEVIKKELIPSVKELNKISALNKKYKNMKCMLILSMDGTSPVVAGSETTGDSFIKMIGAKNIYSEIKGWQAVSEESILKYNPDFIILPQRDLHKNSNVSSVITNPIISKTNAHKNNNLIIDDGMAVLGFGPRTIFSALKAAKKINESTK